MQILKFILFSVFFVVSFTAKSELPDSLINKLDFGKTNYNITITDNTDIIKIVDPNWLFINDDNADLKFGNREERNYTIVKGNSSLVLDLTKDESKINDKGVFNSKFNGIGWYKCYFKVPSNFVNKVYELEFILHGAIEIYLDGKLHTSEGKISSNGKEAKALNITDGSIYFPVNDTSVHCIAIRFGLTNYKEYLQKYPNNLQEPYFKFSMPEVKNYGSNMLSIYFSITNMLSAFFFALFIIHLLIYFFYREQSFNLLYSLFLILLSLTFLEAYLVKFIEDLSFYLWLDNIDNVIFPTVCFILVTILNKLLNEKRSWHYVILCVILVYHYIDVMFIGKFNTHSQITIVFYTYFNTLAHSIKGIRRKVASAKFLGWGILSCTISFILLIIVTLILTLFFHTINNESWVLFIYSTLIIISILSIPISMSAYLAYDFANTNKSLAKKLIEVEELSYKNIEQEKEKQKILAEQNEMLESQVHERTKEIEEQKKLIEEKNKDITDSINYAKRIQRSILPTEKEIKEIFTDSFVLFKPRDIVSGDFYQFKKVDEHCFSILADCTGHGVPGALMSMIGSNLLNQIIVERKILDPSKILSELSKEVRSTLRQTSGAPSHDGMDAAITLRVNNKLYIASANRPVFIIQNGELSEIKPTKSSIGGSTSSDATVFEITELSIHAGMMVYMFSDGYADQFGGEAGKKFKIKKLTEMLLNIHQLPLDDQHAQLNVTFENWKNNLEQVDDVCLIGLRF